MTSNDLHASEVRALSAWEHEYGLFDHRYHGIPLWRLIRSGYISAYLDRTGVRGRDNYNRPSVSNVLHFVVGIARSILHSFIFCGRYRNVVIGFARRRLERGIWVDTFFDPLIDVLGQDETLCIEWPFVGRHFRPALTRNLKYYDGVKACAALAGCVVARLPRRAVPEMEALASLVAERLGVPVARVRRSLWKAYARFWVEREFARAIVTRAKPKVLLLVNRGINHGMIAACRERGVAVYEIQHGVMHVNGYKQGTRYDAAIDPQGFLTFGECWNRFDWGVPEVEVLGYRYIWEQRERQRAAGRPRGDAVMLVSEPGCWQELTDFTDIVAAHPEVRFILKLHPQDVGNWPARYPCGLDTNVTVVDDPSADLYDLFADCRAVVGYGSTVLFEASFFGLKVGLLNRDGKNPNEAIRYIGSYNFYAVTAPDDFGAMLASARVDESVDGNPFFAAFDAALFQRVTGGAHG